MKINLFLLTTLLICFIGGYQKHVFAQDYPTFNNGSATGLYNNGVFYKTSTYLTGIDENSILVAFDSSASMLFHRNYGSTASEKILTISLVEENLQQNLLWGGYVFGFANPPINLNAYLIKTNSQGDTLWTHIYEDLFSVSGINTTTDSSYIVSFSGNHGLLAKINRTNGDTLWSKHIDYSVNGLSNRVIFSGAMLESADSAFYVGGITYPTSNAQFLLAKTDLSGNPIWLKAYGDTTANICWSGTKCHDDGFALAGQSAPSPGFGGDTLFYNDFLIVRTDIKGDTLWCKRYDHYGSIDKAYDVIQTHDNGFAIVGISKSSNNTAIQFFKTILIKTDSLGNVMWVKSYD